MAIPHRTPISRPIALAAVLLLSALRVDPAIAADALGDARERLARAAGAPVVVSAKRGTGRASFVRRLDRGPLDAIGGRRAAPEHAAADFVARHADLFGLADVGQQLAHDATRRDALGWTRVTWRQRHQDLEVFGATLRAHVGPDGSLRAVNGAVVPIAGPLGVTPAIQVAAADSAAIAATGDGSQVVTRRLVIYDRSLLRGAASDPRLAYAVETEETATEHRNLTFVDALDGRVLDTVSLTPDALTRQVSRATLEAVVWSEGDPDPIPAGWSGGDTAEIAGWQDLIDGTRESYMFHGSLSLGTRLGFDGADAPMMNVLYDPDYGGCPTASWAPYNTSARFCPDVTADDVVGHEWAHAYTAYTSDFIYSHQPGALHESYSDVWGETVDLLNGRGTDAPGGLRPAGSCSPTSVRWLLAEDAVAFGGALRDLWHPECKGHPGRVRSSRYHCDSLVDGGGVHINSGVPNHLYALLVDGGDYNDQTVAAIGLVKAASILWRAVSVYEMEVTDFADHADALEQSCDDLIGAPLGEPVTTGPGTWTTSAEVIGAADCAAVAAAIAAVELRDPPPCTGTSILQPNAPALCTGAGSVEPLLTSDFESGLSPWTAGTRAIANPATYDGGTWMLATSLPSLRAGAAAFTANPTYLGNCNEDDETGVSFLESPAIVTPLDRDRVRVAFTHFIATEPAFDGGNVKVSVNGGPFTVVPTARFAFNGYNTAHLEYATRPSALAGEPAWSGFDGASYSGSWGESQLDLVDIAAPGDTVRLRFELGMNGCEGHHGWYVDDVRVHTCSEEVELCPEAPLAGCKTARKSQLVVQSGLSLAKSRLQWSWKQGDATLASELGDPLAGTRYGLCIWDGRSGVPTLVTRLHVADGSGWSRSSSKLGYKDGRASQQGVARITLKAAPDGKASAALQAKGALLELPYPATLFTRFAIDPTVTVQLVSSEGTCFESTFTSADFRHNLSARAQASHKVP